MNSAELKAVDQQYVANTYARFDLALKSGKGATCRDYEGNSYIDFTSGIGVNSLGFCNEKWSAAVAEQASTLNHISNLYYTEPGAVLAESLCKVTGYKKVFFGNSGAEANEGAIKAARKYSYDKYGEGRSTILTLVNSFHGRTVTTLSATGQEHFHQFFFPFTGDFSYALANDIADVKEKLNASVCAVMIEFIQGEGGVVPLNEGFVKELAALCAEKDVLLIADEVQTGVGRTGKFLASEWYGVHPDITTLAKGLGGGLPIGAVLLGEKTEFVLGYGDHGSTFGANPISCAGANIVMETVSKPDLLDKVASRFEQVQKALSGCAEVSGVTGKGMMIGISLKNKRSGDVAKACIEKGLLVLTAKEKVRLLPPLTISDEEFEKGLSILLAVLNQ